MSETAFTEQQIADADRRALASPGVLSTAIGEAKNVAHWVMRFHPEYERSQMSGGNVPQPTFEAEYRQFDARLTVGSFGQRLLVAQEMHARFSALKQDAEAETKRQNQARFDQNVQSSIDASRAQSATQWAERHDVTKASRVLRARMQELETRIGGAGPDGDLLPILDDFESALQSAAATVAIERKSIKAIAKREAA